MDMVFLKTIAEDVVVFGGAAGALFYALKRMYTTARNIEKLVESAEQNKITQLEHQKLAAAARQDIKDDLTKHTLLEDGRDQKRDEKFAVLSASMIVRDAKLEQLNETVKEFRNDLKSHVVIEEAGDKLRDKQLIQLAAHMNEVLGEIRSNGGSSIKDVVQNTNKNVNEICRRVAILEEWKEAVPKKNTSKNKKTRRKFRRIIKRTHDNRK